MIFSTVKPVLSRHSKIDKTKVLKTNGSLMKVESIVECSNLPSVSYHLSLISLFLSIFEWPLKTGFTVYSKSTKIL